MRSRVFFLSCIAVGFLSACVSAQCAPDHRSNKSGGILLKDLSLVGIQALTSDQVAEVAGELTGGCFDEDSDELRNASVLCFRIVDISGSKSRASS